MFLVALLAVAPAMSVPAAGQDSGGLEARANGTLSPRNGAATFHPSGDPTTTYGAACGQSGPAWRTKASLVREALFDAGQSLADFDATVTSIVVLNCRSAGGGPQRARLVDCPAFSQFSYCVATPDDGAGVGDLLLGVVKTTAENGPNGPACGGRLNFQFLEEAGARLDNVTAIEPVKDGCQIAAGPARVDAEVIACPAGITRYSYCVGTPNDGAGHAVTLGVVEGTGTAVYAAYGNCISTSAHQYRRRSDLAMENPSAPASLAGVSSIVVDTCGATGTFPNPTGREACTYNNSAPCSYSLYSRNDGMTNQVVLAVKEGSLSKPDAFDLYGGCRLGAGYRSKSSLVNSLGLRMDKVTDVDVLSCAADDGGGGSVWQACDPSYSFCIRNNNDGFGNSIYLGVRVVTADGDPYGVYGRCGVPSSGYRSKSGLVHALLNLIPGLAGHTLDRIRSIEVTGCGPNQAATYGTFACTSHSRSTGGAYSYCATAGNDGTGNAVSVGVVEDVATPWPWTGVHVSVNPAGAGRITSTSLLDQSPRYGGAYPAGTTVTLTAAAIPGYAFSSFAGDLSGGANPQPLLVNGSKSVVANFVPTAAVTVASSPAGAARSITTASAQDPALRPGGWYPVNAEVTVTATANSGYVFQYFSGGQMQPVATNPYKFTLTGPRNIVAVFAAAAPPPLLAASVAAKKGLANHRTWTMRVTNSGLGAASDVQITGLTFTPVVAGWRAPEVAGWRVNTVFTRTDLTGFGGLAAYNGTVYVSEPGRNRVWSNGTVVAGSTLCGAYRSTWCGPTDLAVDGQGTLYILDSGHNVIKLIDGTIVAGNGVRDYSENGGRAIETPILPTSMTVDKDGNIYIAEESTGRILKVTRSTGIISTIAGTGWWLPGEGYSSDCNVPDVPATHLSLRGPRKVAVDGKGNVYFADDYYGDGCILMLDHATGKISGRIRTLFCFGQDLPIPNNHVDSDLRAADILSSTNTYLATSTCHGDDGFISQTPAAHPFFFTSLAGYVAYPPGDLYATIRPFMPGPFDGENAPAFGSPIERDFVAFDPVKHDVFAAGRQQGHDYRVRKISRKPELPLSLGAIASKASASAPLLLDFSLSSPANARFSVKISFSYRVGGVAYTGSTTLNNQYQ
jgi:hypothetical protein